MQAIIRLLFLALLFTIPGAQNAAAQESRTVTAEGVAMIQQGAVDIARDAALEDAQKRAVEQAIGILIESQTQVENYQLISDKILAQTKGYIKRYNVMNETTHGELLRVVITAEVALGKLEDDLSGIGILLVQMAKPRTMILIAEQNIGGPVNAWWWTSSGQVDISAAENSFIDVFTKKGFEFVDHEAAAQDIKVSRAYQTQDLSAGQARTLGNQAKAEVVIVGKAVSKIAGRVGGVMLSAQADISVRAVRTDTGPGIASATPHAAAVHINDQTAGIEALRKAGTQAAEELLTKILAVFAKEVGGTRSILITINGLTKDQFVKFKDVLRSQVRAIKDLHEKSFSGTSAVIQVDSKSSTQALSDELLLRNFGSFSVQVTRSTANTMELQVAPQSKP